MVVCERFVAIPLPSDEPLGLATDRELAATAPVMNLSLSFDDLEVLEKASSE
eukprot:m.141538 g.141538  ORF g.141538 m.141538 type:complete len:52 (+) comp52602_c0_seq5:802-957(+)